MKIPGSEHTLLWLIRPEDSSSWEFKRKEVYIRGQNKKRIDHSISKLLVWYSMALVVTILLSRLH